MEFIDLKTQYLRYQTEIDARMRTVLQHGHFIMGPEIAELEAELAAYVGAKHAITVASGTDSLEIILRALGVGPGAEVITVPFTWISTAEVILLVGATPVFVDIAAADFNVDVDQIEAAITRSAQAFENLVMGEMERATVQIHTDKPPRAKPPKPAAPRTAPTPGDDSAGS